MHGIWKASTMFMACPNCTNLSTLNVLWVMRGYRWPVGKLHTFMVLSNRRQSNSLSPRVRRGSRNRALIGSKSSSLRSASRLLLQLLLVLQWWWLIRHFMPSLALRQMDTLALCYHLWPKQTTIFELFIDWTCDITSLSFAKRYWG